MLANILLTGGGEMDETSTWNKPENRQSMSVPLGNNRISVCVEQPSEDSINLSFNIPVKCRRRSNNYPFTPLVPNTQTTTTECCSKPNQLSPLDLGLSFCTDVPVCCRITTPSPTSDSTCNVDLSQLVSTRAHLSTAGWYHGSLSWKEALYKLQGCSVGTFLVRDSSDSNVLFSLSVQTERGPTSVRIHYDHGWFYLDADCRAKNVLPRFNCVVSLIDYYVELTRKRDSRTPVWVDKQGKKYAQIQIRKPLWKEVPSLQHFCRLAANKSSNIENMPDYIGEYLRSYPYRC